MAATIHCQRTAFAAPSARAGRRANVVCRASLSTVDRLRAAAAAVVVSGGLLAAPAFAVGVKFEGLKPGATVASPVHLEFAVDGLTVKPAGEGPTPGTGHFHVLVDVPAPEEGDAIPFDDLHKHFGKGQTSTDIVLTPGKHTLVLQFADALHQSYGPKYASSVSVTVE